ncbi:hypothetical protein GALMADRAFT_18440, partial [Galerina marginata CBS 339.88]
LPELPSHPPEIFPGLCYTGERMEAMKVNPSGFLWDEEVKLAHWIIKTHKMAFAWVETKRRAFRNDYFELIWLPVLPHTPWAGKPIPIPPGLREKITEILKTKKVIGVYEDS